MPDPALLQALMDEQGLVAQPPEPSWRAWASARAWQWFVDAMEQVPVIGAVRWGGPVVLGLLAVGGVLLLRWRLRQRRAEVSEPPRRPDVSTAPEDRLAAARELLAAGRPREATRVAWAWMAATLTAGGVGRFCADQTHGEFVGTVTALQPAWPGRAALTRLASVADRACYGVEEPTGEGVAAWIAEVQLLVAGAGGAG